MEIRGGSGATGDPALDSLADAGCPPAEASDGGIGISSHLLQLGNLAARHLDVVRGVLLLFLINLPPDLFHRFVGADHFLKLRIGHAVKLGKAAGDLVASHRFATLIGGLHLGAQHFHDRVNLIGRLLRLDVELRHAVVEPGSDAEIARLGGVAHILVLEETGLHLHAGEDFLSHGMLIIEVGAVARHLIVRHLKCVGLLLLVLLPLLRRRSHVILLQSLHGGRSSIERGC